LLWWLDWVSFLSATPTATGAGIADRSIPSNFKYTDSSDADDGDGGDSTSADPASEHRSNAEVGCPSAAGFDRTPSSISTLVLSTDENSPPTAKEPLPSQSPNAA
jgi:hypothetical protein